MISMLKAPGTKRLNLNCDELLPIFSLTSNLRRYSVDVTAAQPMKETAACVFASPAPARASVPW
jgi:hypothetical protein